VVTRRPAEEAAALAETIRERIAGRPMAFSGGGLMVTASLGVAHRNGESCPATALLKAADDALYRAKKAGRNCVVVA